MQPIRLRVSRINKIRSVIFSQFKFHVISINFKGIIKVADLFIVLIVCSHISHVTTR